MDDTSNDLLKDLLKDVSRSFYKTLRVLPDCIRAQISLAYLLARTTDTIADTAIVSLDQRLQALAALRDRILGASAAPLNFGELAKHQGSSAERALLEKSEASLSLLASLSAADIQLIREALSIIVSGQELDLKRFAAASCERIVALRTDAELDDYTYRVAGCVGEFWTKMCRAHVFPGANLDEAAMLAKGVRFGKGLQLVNVLRDLPADLRQGRCYLPEDALDAIGLKPADLLEASNDQKLRPVYDKWLDTAESHLVAGWEYTNLIPLRNMRIRLACAWPILIGQRTIELLRVRNVLESGRPIKISRAQLRWIIVSTVVLHPWQSKWRGLGIRDRNIEHRTSNIEH